MAVLKDENKQKAMPQEENLPDDLAALDSLVQIEGIADVEQFEKVIPFSGQWNPTIDPLLLKAEDFQSLVNMRYNDGSIEGVNGYTYVNSNAISTYVNIKNGIHLKTQGRTQETYILAHCVSSGGQGRVYVNKTAIGSTGDFASNVGEQAANAKAAYLWSDASTGLDGRFSQAPGENIAYANGEEVFIWSGDEATCASIFTTTDASETDPADVTEALSNSRTDAGNVVELNVTGREHLTILTTRPAQAFKFYVSDANTTNSTLSVKYWNGTAYASVVGGSDGTTNDSKALAQTGSYTFNSTKSTCVPHHFEGRYLYAYQVALSAGSADLSQITVDMPAQKPTNVWDGVYRTPIQCQFYNNANDYYEDYTLHVSESSTVNTPVGVILDAMDVALDKLYLMFDEQMAGLNITMLGNLVNTAATTLQVKYWDGDSWSALTIVDNTGTAGGAVGSFGMSGTVTWTPASDEVKTTLFGTQGYAYQLVAATNDVSDADAGKDDENVVIDIITGIPAQKSIETFKFPVQYKNKLFLCNYAEGNQGNRVDYSIDSAPDVFNGESSSLDGYQSIYVGGSEYLTCACQLYNRFGSNLFTSLIFFKANEMYLLTGDSPIDYQLFPVSKTIGCPAPNTLSTAEVGFELDGEVARNVAMFISNAGPMMYDGAVLYPMRGIEKYFDPNDDDTVNWDYLDESVGWFDSTYKEYNCILPTGSSTTPNTWLVFDLVRKKWYKKNVGTGDDVISGWQVSATNGDQYIYGGTDVGKVVQLEDGTAWGTAPIENEIQTSDIFPDDNPWHITRIRRLKFICKRTNENDTDLNYWIYTDTETSSALYVTPTDAGISVTDSGTAGVSFENTDVADADSGTAGLSWQSSTASTMDISQTGTNRVVKTVEPVNQVGWTHSFKFTFSSSTVAKGLQPLLWGIQFEVVRKDY